MRVTGSGEALGVVVANLAHKEGNRIQVALEEPWVNVSLSSGSQCIVDIVDDAQDPVVAFATEGSKETLIALHPFGTVGYADTVQWKRDGKCYLYQVTGLTLERDSWDGSSVIAEKATAMLLGQISDGELRFEPALPEPYQPIRSAKLTQGSVPSGYRRLGVITGTQFEFGVATDALREHHLAILGMSGMGKSTVTRHLIDLLSEKSFVVAMDGTSEYRTRFEFKPWAEQVGTAEVGCWVHEPAGEPALKAKEFIHTLMTDANEEYKTGKPNRRTLVLEEAHSYLPEWNFTATKAESEWVANSCRYILQARKFGLSLILVSQRTAVISKSALSQCESYIIFRTLDLTSLEYIEGVVGPNMRDAASSLSRYQAICVGPAFSTRTPVIVDLDPRNEPDPTATATQQPAE